MQFFDRPGARSKIALRGSSSRPKTSQELLANAKKAREERAHIRQQHQAARTLQRLYRARAASDQYTQSVLSQSSGSSDSCLVRLVLLSGLVNARPISVSHSLALVRRAVRSRPFINDLVRRQCVLMCSSPDAARLGLARVYPRASDAIILKATMLLLEVAALDSAFDLASAVNTVCLLCDQLSDSSLLEQAKWGLAIHIAKLLRCIPAEGSSPEKLRRTLTHILMKVLARARYSPAVSSDTVVIIDTQVAISLLSIEHSVERVFFSLDTSTRDNVIPVLIGALARPHSDLALESSEADSHTETAAFQWDVGHSVSDQPVQNIAIMLSNVLHLAEHSFAKKESATRWPFIAVISFLVHALPKDVLRLASSEDDDDDLMLDVNLENDASSNARDMQGSSTVTQNTNRLDTAALRNVMARVSSSLDQIVSEESVRNIFAAALMEGHHAVSRVCELFNFLARRERKLVVPLRDALALWRGPRSAATSHVLTSLWRHCVTDSDGKNSLSNGGHELIASSVSPVATSSLKSEDALSKISKAERKSTTSAATPMTTKVIRKDAGPILSVFAATYAYLLYIQDVDEMFDSSLPFSVEEMREIAVLLKGQLFNALFVRNPRLPSGEVGGAISSKSQNILREENGLLDDVTRLLSRLHSVDSQRRFTVGDSFWEAGHGALSSDSFLRDAVEAGPQSLNRGHEEATVGTVPQVVQGNSRQVAVSGAGELIRVAPYLVPFTSRSKIFQSWIAHERDQANVEPVIGSERMVSIRRKRIFEDAFHELNELGAGLRATIRIKFIDEHGLEEAGIDGGGVFKEFMHEVLRLGFSPYSYGLFKETPKDGHLYPNPDAPIASENFRTQFEFLGRLLGKAVFDGLLVDIPLAKFFRLKLLGELNYPTDLMSLDPEIYKNIKYLKSCPAETVEGLGLTFTAVDNAFGTMNEVELKRNGSNIAVTASNRIEYIHRLAHYRMNSQIKQQSEAFLHGFYDVVPSQFIRLFSHEELQLLISGKSGKIDVVDWRRNTRYSGGFNEETPVIRWFWTAISELRAEEQAKMLQFVTSCPRAPLLGFAYLLPGFCIHRAEGSDRLPTASTCMNLLKLPEYRSLKIVRQKLKYALQSNAGFDLS